MTKTLCLAVFAFLVLSFNCFAKLVSSTELINNAKLYDGKTVVYEGEVIGDIMVRGEFAWINVNDNQNAIGIWLDKGLIKDIMHTGSHKVEGDVVEITGIFHRACIEHGGDLDIHAQALRKVKDGKAIVERPNTGKRNLVFVLLGALCLVWILNQLKFR
jgi:hypothetical protein